MKPGRKRGQLNQSHAVGKKKHRGTGEDTGARSRSVAERAMRIADERVIEDVLTEDERWVLEFARR